ncbi:MAG: hypothetical protein SOW45_01745 [Prevotella sp.]|nr:hypothetical protein [Prevotella sp.]
MKHRDCFYFEGSAVRMTGCQIRMTEHELAELFHTTVGLIRKGIRETRKDGLPVRVGAEILENGLLEEVYDTETILAVSFRIQSGHAAMFRRWLAGKVLQKECGMMSVFVSIGHGTGC